MALNVRPLGDRILVEAVEEKEVKKGGIIIPDSAKEKPMESLVVALGTGKTDDNGKKVPFEIKKGDRVLVSKYGGTEIKLDGKEYKILRSEEHTSELQSQSNLVCRLLLEKKKHHRGRLPCARASPAPRGGEWRLRIPLRPRHVQPLPQCDSRQPYHYRPRLTILLAGASCV